MLILAIILSPSLHAQTESIGGIINRYTAVREMTMERCGTPVVLVDDRSGFNVGDRVLLVQMQGATIDVSNTDQYGTVTSFGNAGNYEFNRVKSITGNSITLQFQLIHSYTIAGHVQLVSVPEYRSVSVDREVTCAPWNGETGGIVTFRATDTVTLNADIDVDGAGFRGGARELAPASPGRYVEDFVSVPDAGVYGRKGEGIAGYGVAPAVAGRGGPANGGGGGNNHNAGGGGGAGGSQFDGTDHCSIMGGRGGWSYQGSFSGNYQNAQGLGGHSLPSSMHYRLLMGGGGGAGHDNNNVGSGGANGGGIVIIEAAAVVGNDHTISARGGNALNATYDGAGGGGGGGLIIMSVGRALDRLTLDVSGGNGGNGGSTAFGQSTGPGGGGGAGAIVTLFTDFAARVLAGGKNGIDVVSNSPYGATPGCTGANVFATGGLIPEGTEEGRTHNVTLTPDTTIACGGSVRLIGDVPITNSISRIQWTPTDGLSDSTSLYPIARPRRTTTYTLTYTDAGGCQTSASATIRVISFPVTPGPDTSIVCGASTPLRVAVPDPGAIRQYRWSPTDGLDDPTIASPTARPSATTLYTVTITDTSGCEAVATMRVDVMQPTVTASDDTTILCGGAAQLRAMLNVSGPGTRYQWSPADGLSDPTSPSPIARPRETTTYTVTATSGNGCTTSASTTVTLDPTSLVKITSPLREGSVVIDSTTAPFARCSDVTLSNPGSDPYIFDRATLLGNIEFSVPPGQFPITIPPGGTANVRVCYQPSSMHEQRDTLLLAGNCAFVMPIVSRGLGAFSGTPDCGPGLVVQRLDDSSLGFSRLAPYPNPASGVIVVPIAATRSSERSTGAVSCALYDLRGERVASGMAVDDAARVVGRAMAGWNYYVIDARELPSGLYFVRMNRGAETTSVPVIIGR